MNDTPVVCSRLPDNRESEKKKTVTVCEERVGARVEARWGSLNWLSTAPVLNAEVRGQTRPSLNFAGFPFATVQVT